MPSSEIVEYIMESSVYQTFPLYILGSSVTWNVPDFVLLTRGRLIISSSSEYAILLTDNNAFNDK